MKRLNLLILMFFILLSLFIVNRVSAQEATKYTLKQGDNIEITNDSGEAISFRTNSYTITVDGAIYNCERKNVKYDQNRESWGINPGQRIVVTNSKKFLLR